MEVKVCKRCKKIFQYIAGPALCPKCKQVEEEEFQKVKEYLRNNPGSSLYDVSQETGVAASLIEKFLRQGRLEVSTDSAIDLRCERCGTKIKSGMYCAKCKNEITNELNTIKKSMITEDKPKKDDASARMRYLHSDQIH